jgi:predicted permease
MLDLLLHDFRSSLRVFRTAPSFAFAAVAVLAVGIGANTAMFSVINGVLLRPLPFAAPERLVALYETNPERGWTQAQVAAANYVDWRERSTTFEGIAAHNDWLVERTWLADGTPRVTRVNEVTGNFFELLGAPFARGHGFEGTGDWQDGPRQIVLSHALWTEQLAAAPGVIGTTLELDGDSYFVVGVAGEGFRYPFPQVDAWIPMHWDPQSRASVSFRRAHGMRAIGRLGPSTTMAAAASELTAIATQLEAEYPETNVEMGVGLTSLHEWITGDTRGTLAMLFGAVSLVLLIACANVANLQLARATDRRAEMALRGALGASRGRLVRQNLAESLGLALVGGVLGLAVAAMALRAVVRLLPSEFPRIAEVGLDGRVLLFNVIAVLAACALFGLAPSLRIARTAPAPDLQGSRLAGGVQRGRMTRVLVAVEIALVVPVAIAAVLMIRTLDRMAEVDPGFTAAGTTVFGISLPRTAYPDGNDRVALFDALMTDLRQRPGVDAAGLSTRLPFVDQRWSSDFRAESWGPNEYGVGVRHDEISIDLFNTMQVDFVEGRDFEPAELQTEPVVIVNRAFVDEFFAGGSVVGERVCFDRVAEDCRYWFRVVGVVENIRRTSLKVEEEPSIYGSIVQNGSSSAFLLVSSELDTTDVIDVVTAALRNLDPTLPFHTVTTLEAVVAESSGQERLLLALLSAFAAIAVALAGFGVYSMVAYSTAQRTREIGVRVALGAQRGDVLRGVVTRGLVPAVTGLAIGIVAAVAMAGTFASFVFGVGVHDPLSYGVVAGGLVMLTVLACVAPGRRALRVDPVVALRAD